MTTTRCSQRFQWTVCVSSWFRCQTFYGVWFNIQCMHVAHRHAMQIVVLQNCFLCISLVSSSSSSLWNAFYVAFVFSFVLFHFDRMLYTCVFLYLEYGIRKKCVLIVAHIIILVHAPNVWAVELFESLHQSACCALCNIMFHSTHTHTHIVYFANDWFNKCKITFPPVVKLDSIS